MTQQEIEDLFNYHSPTPDHNMKFTIVRNAVVKAALAIDSVCPPGADRTAAIRKLKEAHMTANASIILEGKSYR